MKIDPRFDAEWRVQVDERVLYTRELDVNTAVSRLCEEESCPVGHGPADM